MEDMIEILILAAIAGFLIFRLNSILGTKDGFQGDEESNGEPHKRQEPPSRQRSRSNVVDMPVQPERDVPASQPVDEVEILGDPSHPGYEGVKAIHRRDETFSKSKFLNGAGDAFEYILKAFADGNDEALKPLLSRTLYRNFSKAIDQRKKAGEVQTTTILSLQPPEILGATLEGAEANIQVRFVSEQLTIVRDKDDQIVQGDPDQIEEITDTWTFTRRVTSRNPNWVVTSTG